VRLCILVPEYTRISPRRLPPPSAFLPLLNIISMVRALLIRAISGRKRNRF
jgi:hypothetical protein